MVTKKNIEILLVKGQHYFNYILEPFSTKKYFFLQTRDMA